MLSLNINGKSIMDICDDSKVIVNDKEIANELKEDANGKAIDFEIKD